LLHLFVLYFFFPSCFTSFFLHYHVLVCWFLIWPTKKKTFLVRWLTAFKLPEHSYRRRKNNRKEHMKNNLYRTTFHYLLQALYDNSCSLTVLHSPDPTINKW
jgi:hypothetical protein